ncbi:MAG TPA: hypothetical protein VK468_12055 [Pyrinomonadaceae bacterium]|nr:hypothetical protein [Pyrinomonadaceae bacterium]
MNDLVTRYDIPPDDLRRGKRLRAAAWTAPLVLTAIPALIFLILSVVTAGSPIFAVSLFVLGVVLSAIGFLLGLIFSGVFAYRYSEWTKQMRERIAADGIRAEELSWFRNELRSSEKRALKAVEDTDLLLADAYRETLASRLTASRIIRSSKRELQATKRRQLKLKQLKTETAESFRDEIERDRANISGIHDEAKQMLAEAESRLQMIEAAATRGSSLAGNQLALKKLAMRSSELPLALQEAMRTRELTFEVEKELQESEEPQAIAGDSSSESEQ